MATTATAGPGRQIVSSARVPASTAEPSQTSRGAVTAPAQNHATSDATNNASVNGNSSAAQPPSARKPPPGSQRPTPAACSHAGELSTSGAAPMTQASP